MSRLLASPVVLSAILILGISVGRSRLSARSNSESESLRAFSVVASVLTSPRCLNCHVTGDTPLQNDAGTPHNMNVKRGADGRGTPAMRCTNCHQDQNSQQLHAPPGRPDWHMPPPEMRMAWQGLSIRDLCRTLKNPATNGGKSTEQLIEHVRDEALVNWGWNPGPGRSVPPLSHEEFVSVFTEWVQTGAHCPE